MDREHARGGFRYLSLVNNGTGDVELAGLSVYFTAAPTQDLQAYKGFFHSNDELLNRIWYAGAYTNRKCYSTHGSLCLSCLFVCNPRSPGRDLVKKLVEDRWHDGVLTQRAQFGTSIVSFSSKRHSMLTTIAAQRFVI